MSEEERCLVGRSGGGGRCGARLFGWMCVCLDGERVCVSGRETLTETEEVLI